MTDQDILILSLHIWLMKYRVQHCGVHRILKFSICLRVFCTFNYFTFRSCDWPLWQMLGRLIGWGLWVWRVRLSIVRGLVPKTEYMLKMLLQVLTPYLPRYKCKLYLQFFYKLLFLWNQIYKICSLWIRIPHYYNINLT